MKENSIVICNAGRCFNIPRLSPIFLPETFYGYNIFVTSYAAPKFFFTKINSNPTRPAFCVSLFVQYSDSQRKIRKQIMVIASKLSDNYSYNHMKFVFKENSFYRNPQRRNRNLLELFDKLCGTRKFRF